MNYGSHLKRLQRIFLPNPLYFITTCTHRRKPLLTNAWFHQEFQAYANTSTHHGVWIGKYVIMPDHLHFFVRIGSPLKLHHWMSGFKSNLSRRWKKIHHDSQPLWQREFFDHVIRSAISYHNKWEYVQNNPIRAGLVQDPREWPWMGEIHPLKF